MTIPRYLSGPTTGRRLLRVVPRPTFLRDVKDPAWPEQQHIGAATRQMHQAFLRRRDRELRRLLAAWVSELEPCMVIEIHPDHAFGERFMGLGLADDMSGTVVLPSVEGTP